MNRSATRWALATCMVLGGLVACEVAAAQTAGFVGDIGPLQNARLYVGQSSLDVSGSLANRVFSNNVRTQADGVDAKATTNLGLDIHGRADVKGSMSNDVSLGSASTIARGLNSSAELNAGVRVRN